VNINEMTVGQVKEIQSLLGGAKARFEPLVEVGKKVFIRTVTHHYTGEVTKCNRDWLELKEAAWIADDGRFNNFLKTGDANEIEPFEDNVRVPTGGILDVTEWKHALPRSVK
jgi:hypothetical protein